MLLAPPEAVICAEVEADTEADVKMVGVARGEAEVLIEKEALQDGVEAGLALEGAEGEGDTEAMEPLGMGEALVVSAKDCDGVLLTAAVGLSAADFVADCSGVVDTVPLMLPGGDALKSAESVGAGEGERALDEEAAKELEAPAEEDPIAVAERVAKELGVVRADKVA